MPRRKYDGDAAVPKPLIEVRRVEYEKASFRLSREVIVRLADYCAFVGDVTGEDPAPDEVIDRAMQRLFEIDRGFKMWLARRSPTDA